MHTWSSLSAAPFASRLQVMYTYAMVVVLLMLNMIIAMFSKTFDKYWKLAQEFAATQFALTVQV